MQHRIWCLLVCVLLALSPALGMAEDGFVMAGFDGEDSTHDWSNNRFFTLMEQQTGVSFTFEQYNKSAKWQEAKAKMFAEGGELPDVLFKASLSTSELIRYTDSGQLLDLKPLLPQHAPNLWALLQAHPDWLEAITLPNGKIGALPGIQPLASQDALWVNQTWLNKLGLSMPTDFASLREVLTAFRDGDPNGNGKADEVPLAFLGPWELKLFAHAFGVAANDYNIYLDEQGTVRFWPLEDSFIQLAREMRGLYADGLLAQDGFHTADALRRIPDDEKALIYGSFFALTPVSLVTYEMSRQYVVMEPFAYEGKRIWRDLVGPISRGAFAITSACEDPAAMLAWVDILYTEEGAIQAMVGELDVDYELDENGYWNWKGGLDAMSATKLSELSVYDTGVMPWMFPQAFYDRYVEENVRRVNAELNQLAAYAVQPFPPYSLTQRQREEVTALQMELGKYVDESLARFVLGETPINDETVAAFRQGLEERGAARMTAFWQEIADAR